MSSVVWALTHATVACKLQRKVLTLKFFLLWFWGSLTLWGPCTPSGTVVTSLVQRLTFTLLVTGTQVHPHQPWQAGYMSSVIYSPLMLLNFNDRYNLI